MIKILKILDKYNNLPRPVKASVWFTICYIIQRGFQFCGMPIYTRIMSPEEFGTYSVFLSWFNLLCVISSLSIYAGVFNKAMIKYEDSRDEYISSVQCLTLLSGLIFSFLILFFHETIYRWTRFSFTLQLLFCLHIVLFPPLQYWSQKQRFLFEYKNLVLITLTNSIASFVLGILFVFISKDKSLALIAVTVLVSAFINFGIFLNLFFTGKCVYNKDYWNWSVKTAVPLLPHYLSDILLGHAGRIMINQICGAAQAGIFNVVYQLSMVMTLLRTGINGAFIPWLYISLKERNYIKIKKVTNEFFLLMWGLTFIFMLIGPEILKIAATKKYYEAVVDIPAVMLGGYFIFIYTIFMNIEIYYEKTKYASIATFTSAALNIFLNFICIHKWGYLSVGYTTMISYFCMALLHYIFMCRIVKEHKGIESIFDIKLIVVCSLLLVAFAILNISLYKYILIRYLLVIVILIIALFNLNRIKAILQEVKRK